MNVQTMMHLCLLKFFDFNKSEDPDEKKQYVAFQLGLLC